MGNIIRGWDDGYSERAELLRGAPTPEDRVRIDEITQWLEDGCPVPIRELLGQQGPCAHTVLDLGDLDLMQAIEGSGGYSREILKVKVQRGDAWAWVSLNVRQGRRGLRFEVQHWGPGGETRRVGLTAFPRVPKD